MITPRVTGFSWQFVIIKKKKTIDNTRPLYACVKYAERRSSFTADNASTRTRTHQNTLIRAFGIFYIPLQHNTDIVSFVRHSSKSVRLYFARRASKEGFFLRSLNGRRVPKTYRIPVENHSYLFLSF